MYYIFFCEKICIQGIYILGEVKEEEDEEDGRASPPPFQPGAQQLAASGAASINDRYHGRHHALYRVSHSETSKSKWHNFIEL